MSYRGFQSRVFLDSDLRANDKGEKDAQALARVIPLEEYEDIINHLGGNRLEIKSLTGKPLTYSVTVHDLHPSCTCPVFVNSGGSWCKHIFWGEFYFFLKSAKPIRDLISEKGDFQESLDPFATLNELEAEYMPLLNEDMIDPDLRGDEFFHESSISDDDSISIEAEPTDPSSLILEPESDVSSLLLPAQESLESVTCAKGSDELSNSPSDRWKAGTIFLRGDIVDRHMSDIVARNEEYYAEAVMGKKNLRQHLFGRLIRILKDLVADFVKDSSMERQSRTVDQVEAFLKGNYRASEEYFVKQT